MNTYTFTYYGWIPGYNDFDQDWFDVKAHCYEEAYQQALLIAKLAKHGPGLVAINGHSIESIDARLQYESSSVDVM